MPHFLDDRFMYDSRHGAALDYISQCLKPRNEHELYWTISYSQFDRMNGARQLPVATLHKLIGIIHQMASQKHREKQGHTEDRFIPSICSGEYRTAAQRKAMVDSVYHFLPLVEESRITVGVLHNMIKGLPCNRKRIVNCSLPVRRDECAALLKFMIASQSYNHGFRYPRGISQMHDMSIRINSEELIDIITRHAHEVDRVIELFYGQECPIEILEERLNTFAALDTGVL